MADSRSRQLSVLSPGLVDWLKRVQDAAPQINLQFVVSKVDMVARESDRIRVIAKVVRQLNDKMGRGFEVLPVARKDRRSLMLAALDSAPQEVMVGGRSFAIPLPGNPQDDDGLDSGFARAVDAATTLASSRLKDGLAQLRADVRDSSDAVRARIDSL